MGAMEPERELSAVERLISDCTTNALDSDGPSLTSLLAALGPAGAKRAQAAPLFGWDGTAKALLKKHRAWIYAAIATAAQWAFSYVPQIPLVCTFIVVYSLTQAFLIFQTFAETVDELAGRLNILRYMVAVHTLRDERWKREAGIEIKEPRPVAALDVARRLVDWDGESSHATKENRARWKIMSDVLNPER